MISKILKINRKFAGILGFLFFVAVFSVFGQSAGGEGIFQQIVSNPTPSGGDSGPVYYMPGGAPDSESDGGSGGNGGTAPNVGPTENAATVAAKEYLALLPELEKLEKKLEAMEMGILPLLQAEGFISYEISNMDLDLAEMRNSYETMKTQYEAKKQEVEDSKQQLQESVSALKTAYGELSDYYAQIPQAGDPVDVTTGNFICSVVDFEAQDYLDKFTVNRIYDASKNEKSFGANWICPLDSRIIRGRLRNQEELLSLCTDVLTNVSSQIAKMNGYEKKWGTGFHSFEDEQKNMIKVKKFYEQLKSYLEEIQTKNEEIDNSNKFVTYGKYGYLENYCGSYDLIYFVDEAGNDCSCLFDGNCWLPQSSMDALKFRIYGLSKDNEIVYDGTSAGGFLIAYSDGSKKIYDEYGILKTNFDRNGNKTLFLSDNGVIYQLVLKTKEILKVERDKENRIVRISGPVSGSVCYYYGEKYLRSVEKGDFLKLSYFYTDNGNLQKIVKGDGSSIDLTYEYSKVLDKFVVTGVLDANSESEHFVYDFANWTTDFVSGNGQTVRYCWNENGQIISVENYSTGNKMFIETTDWLISKVSNNGEIKAFSYDRFDRPVRIDFQDGSYSETKYDLYGNVIYQSDRDGFYNEYSYDSKSNLTGIWFCGNLITKLTYYENGLVRELDENKSVVHLKYNDYGSVTEKEVSLEDGRIVTEKWVYNDCNQVISYQDKMGLIYSYDYDGNKKKVITPQGISREYFYNSRGWVQKIIEKDLNSDVSYVKEIIYDNKGRVKKVIIDGNVVTEKDYCSDGKIASFVAWTIPDEDSLVDESRICFSQGIKVLYEYDEDSRLRSEIYCSLKKNLMTGNVQEIQREVITEIDYVSGFDDEQMIIRHGKRILGRYFFDKHQRIFKFEYPNGEIEQRSYTKAGKIKSIVREKGKSQIFKYNTDGTVTLEITEAGKNPEICNFDEMGRLIWKQENGNLVLVRNYDYYGNLKYESGQQYESFFDYDLNGNLISYVLKDYEGNEIYRSCSVYEKNGTKVTVTIGDQYKKCNLYDGWGRLVESNGPNGNYRYQYNALGECIKRIDDNLVAVGYEYSPDGMISCIKIGENPVKKFDYSLGGVLENVSSFGQIIENRLYDENGNLKEFQDFYGNKTFLDFDQNGKILSKQTNDGGLFKYEYGSKSIVAEKSDGNRYEVLFDDKLRIEKEIDYDGYETSYVYNSEDQLARIIYGKDFWVDVVEEKKGLHKTKIFSNGEKYSIEFLPTKNIKILESNGKRVEYVYDSGLKLTGIRDEAAKFDLEYFYNENGQCIEKRSSLFDIFYTYDSKNRIIRIEDKGSNHWVELTYDDFDRLIQRTYSNGIKTLILYGNSELKNGNVTFNPDGSVLDLEIFLHDENNRVCISVDENGLITRFRYNEKGHLISVEYPYELYQGKGLREFTECGGFVKEEKPEGSLLQLSPKEKADLYELFRKINVNVNINPFQKCWVEKYSYDSSGALIQMENLYGKIKYQYDICNRVISKTVDDSGSGSIFYEWSDEGNLLKIENSLYRISLEYCGLNRPSLILYEDKISGALEQICYEYDALSRRISETVVGKETVRFVYDGLNSDVIAAISENDYSNGILSYRLERLISSENNEENFKTVKNQNENDDNTGYSSNTKFEFGKNSYYINWNDCPIFCVSEDRWSFEKEIDLVLYDGRMANVTGRIDDKGKIESINYDVWGESSDVTSLGLFGNSSLKLKSWLTMFDFGLRDYVPSIKQFSTKDPLKAGGNWYGYCVCDPVNYGDEDGLFKVGMSERETAEYAGRIADFLEFDKESYKNQPSKNNYVSEDSSNVPRQFDCADTSGYVDYVASKAAGINNYSPMATDFAENMDGKNIQGAKDATSSSMYFTVVEADEEAGIVGQSPNDYVTKVVDGFNADVIKKSNDNTAVESEKQRRSEAMSALQNPDNVTPGTVFVWKKTSLSSFQNWVGHTLTVVSREFDADGNISGFVYIEGHTGGNKTSLGYMVMNDSGTDLSSYIGEFVGAFEIGTADYSGNCAQY